MGSKDDNVHLSTGQRMASLATAKASANRIKGSGGLAAERGQDSGVHMEEVESIVAQ